MGRPNAASQNVRMTSSGKALIAIRDPVVVKEVCTYLDRSSLQLAGVVDPRLQHRMIYWRGRVDVIITSASDLRWFPRGNPIARLPPSPPSRLVVLLQPTEVIDLQRHIRRIRGMVFYRDAPELVAGALELATAGYCVLPRDLTSAPSVDEARMQHLDRLSDVERRTLELLAEAAGTRAIARSLDVSDTRAKTLVRAVLTKLHLENRTAGAVFAARSRFMNVNRRSGAVRSAARHGSNGASGSG